MVLDNDAITSMGDVLVVPCWLCGNLLQLYVKEEADLLIFNAYGPCCGNPHRVMELVEDWGCSIGCTSS